MRQSSTLEWTPTCHSLTHGSMAECSLDSLLSSSLLQRHLLPRLCLSDLLAVEHVSLAFRQLVTSAPDPVYGAALARTLPPSHRLARVQTGCRQAAYDYAHLLRAFRTQDCTQA